MVVGGGGKAEQKAEQKAAGKGGGVWGWRSRFKNASAIPRGLLRPLRGSASPRATRADARRISPRRGAHAIVIPKQGRIMRCPSARRRWVVRPRSSNGRDRDFHPRARLSVPCLSKSRPCVCHRARRWFVLRVSQRRLLGLSPPPRRARCIECASIVPCLPSRSAGRSPFKVCSSAPPLARRPLATAFGGDLRSGHTFGSPLARGYVDVCFAFLTDFPRGRGRRGRLTSPPKLGHCPCGARRASPALVVLRGAAMPRQGS